MKSAFFHCGGIGKILPCHIVDKHLTVPFFIPRDDFENSVMKIGAFSA